MATCPKCGTDNIYQGFGSLECGTPGCDNFSPDLAPGDLHYRAPQMSFGNYHLPWYQDEEVIIVCEEDMTGTVFDADTRTIRTLQAPANKALPMKRATDGNEWTWVANVLHFTKVVILKMTDKSVMPHKWEIELPPLRAVVVEQCSYQPQDTVEWDRPGA